MTAQNVAWSTLTDALASQFEPNADAGFTTWMSDSAGIETWPVEAWRLSDWPQETFANRIPLVLVGAVDVTAARTGSAMGCQDLEAKFEIVLRFPRPLSVTDDRDELRAICQDAAEQLRLAVLATPTYGSYFRVTSYGIEQPNFRQSLTVCDAWLNCSFTLVRPAT